MKAERCSIESSELQEGVLFKYFIINPPDLNDRVHHVKLRRLPTHMLTAHTLITHMLAAHMLTVHSYSIHPITSSETLDTTKSRELLGCGSFSTCEI